MDNRLIAVAIASCGIVAGISACALADSAASSSAGETKAEILQHQAEARATAPAPSKQEIAQAKSANTSSQLPPRTEGIDHTGQSPFPAIMWGGSDLWQGPGQGRWLVAYAGASTPAGGGASEGAIAVYEEPVDPNDSDYYFNQVGIYELRDTQRLTITGYKRNVLTLTTSAGSTAHFDVANLSFS